MNPFFKQLLFCLMLIMMCPSLQAQDTLESLFRDWVDLELAWTRQFESRYLGCVDNLYLRHFIFEDRPKMSILTVFPNSNRSRIIVYDSARVSQIEREGSTRREKVFELLVRPGSDSGLITFTAGRRSGELVLRKKLGVADSRWDLVSDGTTGYTISTLGFGRRITRDMPEVDDTTDLFLGGSDSIVVHQQMTSVTLFPYERYKFNEHYCCNCGENPGENEKKLAKECRYDENVRLIESTDTSMWNDEKMWVFDFESEEDDYQTYCVKTYNGEIVAIIFAD